LGGKSCPGTKKEGGEEITGVEKKKTRGAQQKTKQGRPEKGSGGGS